MQEVTDEPTQEAFFTFTNESYEQGLKAGVDEVGIGPLAGPVVAAAVLLDPRHPVEGVTDSKALTPEARETLAREIKAHALAWCVAEAGVAEIDELNILRASHLAMQRAVEGLATAPRMVLVDGNKVPTFAVPAVSIVQGDRLVPQIGAASILAKVARDETMRELADAFPGYGLEKHKGYPTREHVDALAKLGASAIHRRSFAPVRDVVEDDQDAQVQLEIAAKELTP